MNNIEMSPSVVLQKLEMMETELREIRVYLSNSMNDVVKSSDRTPKFEIKHTLEELYQAFGSKKAYAVRLKNALQKRGVTTLEEFLSMSPGELMELENVGNGTLLKTKKAIERLGIRW